MISVNKMTFYRGIVVTLLDIGPIPLVHDATVKRTPLHAASM